MVIAVEPLVESFGVLLQQLSVCSFINAPVDFEEVKLSHSTTDAEYDNAILAVKRNHIALKGKSGECMMGILLKGNKSQSFGPMHL